MTNEDRTNQDMAKQLDPRELILESYRIDGIDLGQCRSIFLDWVLGAAATPPVKDQIAALLDIYGPDHPDHPMTQVLKEGQSAEVKPQGRRGGWRGRSRP